MIMLYFSGTGNSKYIAENFGKRVAADCRSIEEDIDFAPLIEGADTIGFCYPIYGSCVPRIMREFVQEHADALLGKKLIIFCTQLMFSGDGTRAFTELLPPQMRANVIYAEHFNMPNNLCNLSVFRVRNGEENCKKLSRAEKKLDRVCRDLSDGKTVRRGFNIFSRILGLTQSKFFPAMETQYRSDVKTDQDCNGCGLCVKLCPMHNLALSADKKITQHSNCTICYRCVNACPKQAITVGIHNKVKDQYKGIIK